MDIRYYVERNLRFARKYAEQGDTELVKAMFHDSYGAVRYFCEEHSHENYQITVEVETWWDDKMLPLFLKEIRVSHTMERV